MPLSSSQLRKAWKAYAAAPEKLATIPIGSDAVRVAPETAEVWKAFDAVLTAHGYKVRKKDTDTYANRKIAGTNVLSLHAYGIALDLNWDTNPVKYDPKAPVRFSGKATQDARAEDVRDGIADTDMTRAMIDDILAIRTNDGVRPLEWGGDWKSKIDTMHFEIDVTPADLASGVNWATVRTEGTLPDHAPPPVGDQPEAPPPEGPSDAFYSAHKWIEKWEGGFSNHPSDPGGATNYGVTQAVLAQWRGHAVSIQDVRDLSPDEARRIFHARYWRPMRCDELPYAVALMAYNCGVNSGPGRGGRFLQSALNRQGASLEVDGSIGPRTIAAAATADQGRLVRDFRDLYEAFYRGLPTWPVFGKGWMNRLTDIAAAAAAHAGISLAIVPAAPSTETEQPLAVETAVASDTPATVAPETTSLPAAQTEGTPAMTAIDTALGGQYLVGKKTLIAGFAFAALTLFKQFNPEALGTDPAAMYDMLTKLIATFGGLGALSKIERLFEKAKN